MRSFLRSFLRFAVPLGIWIGIYSWLLGAGTSQFLLNGAIGGILAGLLIAGFTRAGENRSLESPPVLLEETLSRQGRATHYSANRGIPGRLYLTDRRLLFEGYLPNKPVHEVSIPIHDVVAITTEKFLGIFVDRLVVTLNSGEVERFSTDDPVAWCDEIMRRRTEYVDELRSDEKRLFR